MTEARAAGRVVLVGAGPGDPELLTLRAARRIGEADVILVDALVDRAVLRHARPGARVVDVGKRGGCRSTPQEFIERLMVRLARRGQVVVRVKGGDPFVFGRGGEEALAMARAGIACEVVSGVTSGVAAPARAGIPVTHRGLSTGVTFVSAHDVAGGGTPWEALVRSRTTLVVFMGVASLGPLVRALLAAGMEGRTPCAAIERATERDERVLRAPLARLAEEALRFALASPALLVVGECVSLAEVIAPALAGAEPRARAA